MGIFLRLSLAVWAAFGLLTGCTDDAPPREVPAAPVVAPVVEPVVELMPEPVVEQPLSVAREERLLVRADLLPPGETPPPVAYYAALIVGPGNRASAMGRARLAELANAFCALPDFDPNGADSLVLDRIALMAAPATEAGPGAQIQTHYDYERAARWIETLAELSGQSFDGDAVLVAAAPFDVFAMLDGGPIPANFTDMAVADATALSPGVMAGWFGKLKTSMQTGAVQSRQDLQGFMEVWSAFERVGDAALTILSIKQAFAEPLNGC